MKKPKETFVFVFLVTGLVATMVGLALVSRGLTYGWGVVAVGVPILVVAARSMRLRQTNNAATAAVLDAKDEEPSAGT